MSFVHWKWKLFISQFIIFIHMLSVFKTICFIYIFQLIELFGNFRVGAQGERGPAGEKGEPGEQGIAGPLGEIGPAGPKVCKPPHSLLKHARNFVYNVIHWIFVYNTQFSLIVEHSSTEILWKTESIIRVIAFVIHKREPFSLLFLHISFRFSTFKSQSVNILIKCAMSTSNWIPYANLNSMI